jgi:hypothetical protein
MPQVHALFDCKHETDVEISIEDDVHIPERVRGLGQCPACMGEERVITIPGVAPQPGGRELVLDSVMVMAVEG